MSSFNKRQKVLKRTHKERGQVHSRKHLGILEKHKDYVLRAKDYQKKKAQLKLMHEKARNRNPDEFYYKMVKTKLKGGRHILSQDSDKHSPEELQLMKTQDEKYVQMKLATEKKKVERLKSCLHHTQAVETHPQNTHTIFLDSVEEISTYTQACEDRETARKTARSERKTASRERKTAGEDREASGRNNASEKKSSYKELNQRVQRCKELSKVALKMKTQKELMGKGHRVKVKSDGNNPAVYKWKKERQK